MSRPLVTFDLFSALIDSRMGASAVLDGLAHARGWPVDGGTLYDVWDARNKASQRDLPTWVPFAEHCRRALAGTYAELGLPGDAGADVVVHLVRQLERAEPRGVQDLVGIGVADAADQRLVGEGALELPAAAGHQLRERLAVDVHRARAQPRDAGHLRR